MEEDDWGIPLLPQFYNDGRESFQQWSRRFEVTQDARYRHCDVDLNSVLALELPTVLPTELFVVWDTLPLEIKSSYTATKARLQEHLNLRRAVQELTYTVANLRRERIELNSRACQRDTYRSHREFAGFQDYYVLLGQLEGATQ